MYLRILKKVVECTQHLLIQVEAIKEAAFICNKKRSTRNCELEIEAKSCLVKLNG